MTRAAALGAAVLWLVTVGTSTSTRADTATVSFQQGVNGYLATVDTFLKQAAPGTSYGASGVVEWDGDDAGGKNFGLLRFDDIFGSSPDQIPPDSIILGATLTYEVTNPGNNATVNDLLVNWTESTTYNTFGGEAGVQADEYGAEVGTAAGGDGTQTLDVTSSLSAWSSDPTANMGWIFRPTGGTNGVEFRSSEYLAAAARPELQVTRLHLVNEIGIHPETIDTVAGSADIDVIVAIPPGSNDAVPVQVTLTTDDPNVAVPVGATGGALAITFPVGGATHQAVSIDIGQSGGATITTSNDAGHDDTVLTVNVAAGAISFDPVSLSSLVGLDVAVQISISPGSNDTRPVLVILFTDNAAVAEPAGSSGGALLITFATGASNEQIVTIDVGDEGDATITTLNGGGLDEAALPVHVLTGFMFSTTSDMRSYTGPGQFPAVLDAVTATGGPGVFMVCPGDVDPPQNVDAAIDAEFGADYDWYPVVGNHEAETPADMTWIRNEFANLPYIVNGGPSGGVETTYSFEYGNAHFVVLNEYYDGVSDVGTDGDIVPELYAWLEDDLGVNTKKWVFVLGHEPAYPQPDMHWGDSRHIGDSLDQYPAHRDAFWALLDAYNATAYITAHTHRYSRYLQDDVWQIDTAQARGTGQYDTFQRMLVGECEVVLHVYRSLEGGTFRLVDTLTIYDQCTGDLDGDGQVGLADLAILLANYGTNSGAMYTDGDLDRDGDVDSDDLVALLLVYGSDCS
ncbi:MAG: DNRLRE domain-containing protein [Phycisphaerales bacterium]|nr:DNRLRE domain-containing protein [Phycisphaerales bacterium]